MPGFGAMNPFPRKFGGGRSRTKVILESLTADRGTALDAGTETTTAYIECLAIARAIASAWATNQRLANMWTPERMGVDVLARWERFLGLTPAPEDTEDERRARVMAVFERFGRAAISSEIAAALIEQIGDAFVAVEYIGYANAYIQVPDGTYPFGVVGSVPWASTVAHVLIRLQKPTGWTEGDFYEAAAQVGVVLAPMLPAWCTYAWYRPGPIFSPISGGPSAAGFYLDDPSNLDNQIFGA